VGLWKRGRHPNYFGEILFWWGMWVMYASLQGFDGFIGGPIAMTALFLGISIPLMEKRQLKNKPGYAEYRKQTRILI
jgi:steroid 5-alpha reductase family enzyme